MPMDLATVFATHIAAMRERADAALEAAGFDHLLIYSGSLHYGFLDDNPYPFKVNPHFKRWVPVTDNPQCLLVYTPGNRPKLAFHSPVDFWHKTHTVPHDFWTEHFDIAPVAALEDVAALLPANRDHAAYIGEPQALFAEHGVNNVNPPALVDHLHYHFAWKTAYEIECIREANRL
ncbi:MAG TPA: Xaa-Pro dipeptidase, partial [Gammaproteobacteria bacterium]